MKKNLIIASVLLVVVVGGIWFFSSRQEPAAISSGNSDSTSYDIQGMKIETLTQGSGPTAKAGDTVTVNYVGTLQDGTKFDSSVDRGQPFEFTLGLNSVIQGWELGVAGMNVGEKRRLTIPPELAYGSQGAGGIIPPNATLVFEIDMLGIK